MGRGAVSGLRNGALALGSLGLPTRKAAVLAAMTATEKEWHTRATHDVPY